MATFNRSEIMKSAWNFVRTAGKTISEGLKEAWAKAKQIIIMKTIQLGKVTYNVLFENERGFLGQDAQYPTDIQAFVKSAKAIHGFRPEGETLDAEIVVSPKLFRQHVGCYLFSEGVASYNNESSEVARLAAQPFFA